MWCYRKSSRLVSFKLILHFDDLLECSASLRHVHRVLIKCLVTMIDGGMNSLDIFSRISHAKNRYITEFRNRITMTTGRSNFMQSRGEIEVLSFDSLHSTSDIKETRILQITVNGQINCFRSKMLPDYVKNYNCWKILRGHDCMEDFEERTTVFNVVKCSP